MPVTIRRHAAADAFLARTEPCLLRAEAENNLALGIARHLRQERIIGGAYLVSLERDGEVLGAAVRVPPRKLVLTDVPVDTLAALAEDLAGPHADLPAVVAPDRIAKEFAAAWSRRTGAVARIGMRQRIHRLDRVDDTPPRSGSLRLATPADASLVAAWAAQFAEDAGVDPPEDPPEFARTRIERGAVFLWEDGTPVSMAGWRQATGNCSCVSLVYTPADFRGRGYATACVAALTRWRLDAGDRFCVLFTDLANPTSNRIYRRIGYLPVLDVTDWRFG